MVVTSKEICVAFLYNKELAYFALILNARSQFPEQMVHDNNYH